MRIIFANAVWPALFLEAHLFSLWPISFGLVVEYLFVRKLTKLSIRECILINLSMNAASSLIGIFLIPIGGILREIFPGILISSYYRVGTFNKYTWIGTFFLAVAINAVVETAILHRFFQQKNVKIIFCWMCIANSVSVAIAYVSLWTQCSTTPYF